MHVHYGGNINHLFHLTFTIMFTGTIANAIYVTDTPVRKNVGMIKDNIFVII